MEEKKSIKISLTGFLLIVSIVIIIIMGYFLYRFSIEKNIQNDKVSNLESTVSNLKNSINNINSKVEEKEIKNNINLSEKDVINDNKKEENVETTIKNINSIPDAKTNLSSKEEQLIINYFKGIWITKDGRKILAVDYGKRYCIITGNNKEYGTYEVEENTIFLNDQNGTKTKLELTQGNCNYLRSTDLNEEYVEINGYYFGANEGDEGIFTNQSAVNVSIDEEKSINNFKGLWITKEGNKVLAVDYGKRYCIITGNNKEYGTYEVEENNIILNNQNGVKTKFDLTQGNSNYLRSTDSSEEYVEINGYYFGASDSDEGIFTK